MPFCKICGIFVNDIGKHLRRDRCNWQHIKLAERKALHRQEKEAKRKARQLLKGKK